ncbi:hypothetical protein BS47DRAFT_1349872 [Hydnum rufescens UP504]|uniref:Het-C-domain-containing protein n=1 Tax=Hydnum rufescens UP504 TaxID=1448309 RepID=A0A9P6DNE6_9AGAM|nr:hypothetical protein BS47DRAFT_1349872 [Hydnum rufescens UP504]
MPTVYHLLPILLLFALTIPGAYAFGAGEIPDFAYLNDKAFRHGDIENILKEMYKTVGGHHGMNLASGAMGILSSISGALISGRGSKFSTLDVKRVYLGNFLCDYSQAMDIAGLTKLTANSILTIVMALSFMSFGFATAEFEVTAERLGVYLPVTHIDNPKGYGDGQDPRKINPQLRPPVDPRELQIDEANGMKNYIATEGRSWDTSSALLKRVFRKCIQHGRSAQGEDGPELYEAFRLLGTGLHTLEDFLAHSNWCELSLRKIGHRDVFCHVGDSVLVRSPRGERVPPIVTGTFGSADFLHSLLGEATDHLSEASLTDLTQHLGSAAAQSQSQGTSPIQTLTNLFSKIPSMGSTNDKLQQGESMKKAAINLDVNKVAPKEVQKQLWDVLVWRDGLMKDISNTIAKIPGLESLLDQFTEALNVYVFTILEPFMTPILQDATQSLQSGSSAIISANKDSQFEVFNDPRASDPSHSMLSKDHFALILNEPAGKVAMVVVKHSVELIVNAWYDTRVPVDQVIDKVLEAFHHPYYATGQSQVQRDMADEFHRWYEGMNAEDRTITLGRLTKQSVRDGKNKRVGHEDADTSGCGHGPPTRSGQPTSSASENYGDQWHTRPQPTYSQPEEATSYVLLCHMRDQIPHGRAEESLVYGRTDNQGLEQPYGYQGNDSTSVGGWNTGDTEGYGYGRPQHSQNVGAPHGSGRTQQVGGRDHSYQSPLYGNTVRGEQRDTEPTYTDFGRENPRASSYGRDREEQSSYEPPQSEYFPRQEVRPQTHRDPQYGREREEQPPYLQEHSAYSQRGDSLGYNHRGRQEGYHETEQVGSVGYRGSDETYGETNAYQTQRGYGDYRERNQDEYGRRSPVQSFGEGPEVYDPYAGGRRRHNDAPEDETFGAGRLTINDEAGYGGRPSEYDQYSSRY